MKNKIRRMRTTRWNKLTTGEKVAKVMISLVKTAAIIAIVLLIASIAVAVAAGVAVAFGIASAIAGGFSNASRAYTPGEKYVRFW